MNLTTFIRTECCNHKQGQCMPNSHTCQVSRGLRCGFLERCVLPIQKQDPPLGQGQSRYSKGLQHERQDLAMKYQTMVDNGELVPANTRLKGSGRGLGSLVRADRQIKVVLYGERPFSVTVTGKSS